MTALGNQIVESVREEFGDDILSSDEANDQLAITTQAARPLEILTFFRDRHAYHGLVDITATDCGELECDWEFEVIYLLRSTQPELPLLRIHIAVLGRKGPKLPTAAELWPAAQWPEREIAEMFGITFKEHPDPRKLLLPENFEGNPLRKEYPVTGQGERESFPTLGRKPARPAAEPEAEGADAAPAKDEAKS